jgi:membrane fusion protein (multidrug efflux system)
VYRQVYLYVVAGKQSAQRVERRPVETGLRKPGFVEVTAGLKAGETVVTEGYMGLADGSPVEITGRFRAAAPAYNPRTN